MAARDRYTIPVECPQCGTKGSREAEVSEDDHPYMRDPGLRIDEMPPEFTHVYARRHNFVAPGSYGYSPYHADQDAICKKCGHQFPMWPRWNEKLREAFRVLGKKPC